jgi:AraC-like DNA-binding protein
LSFKTLTEETRRDLALRVLGDQQYGLAEGAFLTGFSDQSSFTRAFKRWLGTTPAGFQKQTRDVARRS